MPSAPARAFPCATSSARWSDLDGKIAPHDGVTRGELYVRGPWIVAGYYNDEPATKAALDKEGWFKTGDVVVIDPEGYIQIVDRSKDVIKSGGEWISSIDVENAMMAYPDVAEAAVIGLPIRNGTSGRS